MSNSESGAFAQIIPKFDARLLEERPPLVPACGIRICCRIVSPLVRFFRLSSGKSDIFFVTLGLLQESRDTTLTHQRGQLP
jgi:hypothetical protein